MADDTIADDWELAFLGGAAGAYYAGAGLYFAVFRSNRANVLEPFYLTAAGVGFGGNASGFDLTQTGGPSYSAVQMVTPFSLRMLHLSAGFYVSGGVAIPGRVRGIPLNFGYSYLNAANNGRTYFTVSGPGISGGSGAGATGFIGTWYSHRLNHNSVNPVTAYVDSFRQTLDDLTASWRIGLENLERGILP